jgi:hypothetical protein
MLFPDTGHSFNGWANSGLGKNPIAPRKSKGRDFSPISYIAMVELP